MSEKKKYLQELAQALQHFCSFSQMQEILKDYTDFLEETEDGKIYERFGTPHEIAKEILGSEETQQETKKNTLVLFGCILLDIILLCFVTFGTMDTKNFLWSVFFCLPALAILALYGKKRILIQTFLEQTQHKTLYICHGLFFLITILLWLLIQYLLKVPFAFSTNPVVVGQTMGFLLHLGMVLLLCGMAYGLYFALKQNFSYYMVLFHGYGAFLFLQGIKEILTSMDLTGSLTGISAEISLCGVWYLLGILGSIAVGRYIKTIQQRMVADSIWMHS